MIKIAYVDTDQYQIDDNVISLSKESTASLLEHFKVSGSIDELLDNLKISGATSLEEKNEIKEVEGSLGEEDEKSQRVESSQKYSFRTTDENGVVHYYKIVKNNVIPVKNL